MHIYIQSFNLKDNFGYRTLHRKGVNCKAKNKKAPTKCVRPPSQRGKVERRIRWKERKRKKEKSNEGKSCCGKFVWAKGTHSLNKFAL